MAFLGNDADLAVLSEDGALDLHFERVAIGANARQQLSADVGTLGTDVTVAGTDDEALAVLCAEAVRKDRVVGETDENWMRVALRLPAGGSVEATNQLAAGEADGKERV